MRVTKVIFALLVFFNFAAFAQPPMQNGNTPKAKSVITGKVVDSETGQQMEYANVSIYSNDSALISGSITDSNGIFSIDRIDNGTYYVEANFIGFNKTRINNIRINDDHKEINLGTIELAPSTQEIGTVNVVADRARVEYKIDKKVINVSQSINAIGATAVEVLENTPSVQVDIEGNVTVRGSSNFTVLIDGRPSVLSGSEALQQIPSSAIENIEIITNPSVKYDPDGMAGIINIIMKKNITSGFNGIVNTSIGTGDKKSFDLTVNQKTKKRNISFGIDLNDRSFEGKNTQTRETFANDTTYYLEKFGTRGFTRSGYTLKGGTDFYLSDLTTLGFSAKYGHYNFESGGRAPIYQYTNPASEEQYTLEVDPSKREGNYISGDINFQHKFNEEGTHKLEGMFYYSHNTGNDLDEEGEVYATPNFEPTDVYYSRLHTIEDQKENEYRFKVDYTKPLANDGKLEAGYQGRIDKENEDYLFENYEQDTQDWIYNDLYSSSMEFSRAIHSMYTTYSSSLNKLEYMVGLRGEYTDREIKHAKVNEPYDLQRLDFFPSAHLSYSFPHELQLMASYSRRINRPRGRDLDPFDNYRDQYTIRKGNPDLEPEYTNSYELNLMKRFGRSFVSLEGFYRVTNNLISHLDELGENNIIYQTTVNLNNDYSQGGEFMSDLQITDWFNLNTSVSVYAYKIEDESEGQIIERKSTNVDGRINSMFKFSQNSRMQLMGMFRGPSVTAQGDRDGMFYSNISYKQDFLNKKLTASVSVSDILGTAQWKGTTTGPNFKNSFQFKREPRVVMFTLSYKINNYKMDKSPNGANEINYDDEGGF